MTSYFLVTGATRYALSSQGVAAVLGYDLKTQATVLPAALLDLLPSGPALSPAAATAASGDAPPGRPRRPGPHSAAPPGGWLKFAHQCLWADFLGSICPKVCP